MLQSRRVKSSKRPDANRKQTKPQHFRCVSNLDGTRSIHLPTSLKPKLGFEILKPSGIGMEFCREDKIRCFMLSQCIKYFPGYEDDPNIKTGNEAVIHVMSQCAKLLGNMDYGFTKEIPYYDLKNYMDTIQDFNLNIIYEVFHSAGECIWADLKGVVEAFGSDEELKECCYMCLRIIIQNMGFSIFDVQGGHDVMPIRDWYDWESQTNSENYDYEINEVKTDERLSKKELKKREHEVEKTYQDYERDIDDCFDEYCNQTFPLCKEIRTTRISTARIKVCIQEHKQEDVGIWMNHILLLHKLKFKVYDYMPEMYGNDDMTECVSFQSAFGYVYSAKSLYVKSMLENWSETANSAGAIPLSNFMVINNQKGILKQPTNTPVLAWIQKIFDFHLATLKYPKKHNYAFERYL